MTKSKQVYIYGITDALGVVRYVGKSNDVERRFKDHLSEQERDYPLYRWLRKCTRLNEPVHCVVLACATSADWQSLERQMIKQYREDTPNLLNLADGGDEPKVTLEQRRALARKLVCPLEVRQANGRKVSAAIQADPFRAKLHKMKLRLSAAWVKGDLPQEVKEKLIGAAFRKPTLFGCFIDLAVKHG
jgi:predicted GIY-YIG superfamily endonuclease